MACDDLRGTDRIARPVNETFFGRVRWEARKRETCGSDSVPHDHLVFCFHRAELGLAGRLFVLARRQQFTATVSGCCFMTTRRSPGNYDIMEND